MPQIRPLLREELPHAAQVVRLSFAGIAEEFAITPQNYPQHAAFLSDETIVREYDGGMEMLGLFEGNLLRSYISMEKREGTTYYIERLCTLPSHRHKGYGRELLDEAARRVRQRGGGYIMLGALARNTRLVEWYKAYGFKEASVARYDHIPHEVSLLVYDASVPFTAADTAETAGNDRGAKGPAKDLRVDDPRQ